jgi:peptidoglycan hydrolase CwlO-like protein
MKLENKTHELEESNRQLEESKHEIQALNDNLKEEVFVYKSRV